MKQALHDHGSREGYIKEILRLEDEAEQDKRDLAEVEARLMNLQLDLTAQLAHKIKQVRNQPTGLKIVRDET